MVQTFSCKLLKTITIINQYPHPPTSCYRVWVKKEAYVRENTIGNSKGHYTGVIVLAQAL